MQIKLSATEISELKLVQLNVSGSNYIKVTCFLMLHKGVSSKDVSEYRGIDTSRYLGNNYKGYWACFRVIS